MSTSQTPPRHIVAVAGLVCNSHDQILLLHSPRGDWEFPGGQVEEGETLTGALQREILEETGITATAGALVGVYSNILRQSPIVMLDFLCEWVAGEPTASDESTTAAWVARADVLARIQRPAIYQRMKDLLEFEGRVIYRAYRVDPHQIHAEYEVVEERFV